MRPLSVLTLGAVCAALTCAGSAFAAEGNDANSLHRAVEEAGVKPPPRQRFSLPEGSLKVTPSALLAAHPGQPLRFTVALSQAVPGATLEVRLPRRWVTLPASGIRAIRAPRLSAGTRRRARVHRAGTLVKLTLERAGAGRRTSFDIVDVGIPPGTYRLRFSWRDEHGRRTRAGTAIVRFYAPAREGPPSNPWLRLNNPGVTHPVVSDSKEESETFIATRRGDKNRVGLGSNWDDSGGSMPFFVSDNAGATWSLPRVFPTTIDVPGSPTDETGSNVCCDPMAAADDQGNIWFGGLTLDSGAGPGRIVVARIASGGTTFPSKAVGLATGDDKPLMTIDSDPSSPTYGRLYVVWNHSSGVGIRIQISQCDTQPNSDNSNAAVTPASCDNADNWSTPVNVTPTAAGYIYADVAVGPDGKVYVTWWDFSNLNAIRGDVCDPGSKDCASGAGWSDAPAQHYIALLNSTGGLPVPFQCPILAQPGGRDAPEPQVAVDGSGGPNAGRVYVTWGDLRAGSGTTRCNDSTPGAATHLKWDSFVASAAGGLPGGQSSSSSVGTRLITDGEGAAGSDDWFPGVAVDQTNGQAWVDLYSTREDPTRRTTQFYARSVTPSGSTHTLGVLTKVSKSPSDYSGPNFCDPVSGCDFLDDYGDYEGIAATGGVAYPVWTDNSGTGRDGDPDTFVASTGPAATTDLPSGITTTGATLHATINPGGLPTTYRFQYGSSPGAQTLATATAPAGSGSSPVAVSATVSGLLPARSYFVHVVATNAAGTSNWTERAFATTPIPPTVVTGAATGVGSTGATLHGTVNPNGRLTTTHFEYGKSISYGSSTTSANSGSSFTTLPATAGLGSLSPATTYHYRVVASNVAGARFGSDRTFTTTATKAADTVKPNARVRKVRCKHHRCTITIKATDRGGRVKKVSARVKGKVKRCRRVAGVRRCKTKRVSKKLKLKKRAGGIYRAKIKLKPARYVLRVVATDTSGNRSKAAKKKFRVR